MKLPLIFFDLQNLNSWQIGETNSISIYLSWKYADVDSTLFIRDQNGLDLRWRLEEAKCFGNVQTSDSNGRDVVARVDEGGRNQVEEPGGRQNHLLSNFMVLQIPTDY